MKLLIGKSALNGQGLFAKKQIKKGEIVFIVKGKKVNFIISDKEKAEIASMDWFGLGKNEWIDPVYLGKVLNHSCTPNCGIKGRVVIIALRDISEGEEITIDYSFNEADIFCSMECNCKSENCRKTIKSIQYISTDRIQAYIKFIPKYYQMIYNKFCIEKYLSQEEFRESWVNFICNDTCKNLEAEGYGYRHSVLFEKSRE